MIPPGSVNVPRWKWSIVNGLIVGSGTGAGRTNIVLYPWHRERWVIGLPPLSSLNIKIESPESQISIGVRDYESLEFSTLRLIIKS